jgi:hypothetical protein
MMDLITENARVAYVPEGRHIDVRCSGFLTYQQVVKVTEFACQMIHFYSVGKCVINLQHCRNYPYGAEEYLRDIWYRKLVLAGVCKIAFVVPKDVFGRASMAVVHAGTAIKNIERDYFLDEMSATIWLNNPFV